MTEEYLRSSTLLKDTPHVKLLEEYLSIGDKIFEVKTPYYFNAKRCLETCGNYFDIKNEKEIIRQIKRFIDHFNGKASDHITHQSDNPTPLASKNAFSEYYEVIDGIHRLAIAYVKGVREMDFRISDQPSISLIQELVLKNCWTPYQTLLYQPISCPELQNFTLVRKCTDRFELMKQYLSKETFHSPTFLDLGCSYGYFLSAMEKFGFSSYGVDSCPNSITLGHAYYGMPRKRLLCLSLENFFEMNEESYDVVSLLSVLHHFVLGKGQISAKELMTQVDKLTKNILFIDTGQNHEEWFKKSLPEWDPAFIQKFLLENTTFKKIIPLGTDTDNTGVYAPNYRRTLFACLRH